MSSKSLLLLVGPILCFGQASLTVDDAVRQALASNPDILAANLGVAIKTDDAGAARAERWPRLQMQVQGGPLLNKAGITFADGALGVYPGVGPIPGATTTIEIPRSLAGYSLTQVSMPLTQQPRLGIQVKVVEEDTQMAREQLTQARLNLESQVRGLYYQLIALEKAEEASKTQVEAAEELVRVAERAVDTGTALQTELLAARAKLSQSKADAMSIQRDLTNGHEQLNYLMGRNLDVPFEVVEERSEADGSDLQAARKSAVGARPEVKEANIRLTEAGLAVRAKEWEYVPDVSLTFTYVTFFNASSYLPEQLAIVGFNMAWEPWDWGRKRHEEASLREKQEQARLSLVQMRRQVELQAGSAWRELSRAQATAEAAHAATEGSAEALRVVKERNARQAALIKDVLEAEGNWEAAGQQEARAVGALAVARANFEAAIGKQ